MPTRWAVGDMERHCAECARAGAGAAPHGHGVGPPPWHRAARGAEAGARRVRHL